LLAGDVVAEMVEDVQQVDAFGVGEDGEGAFGVRVVQGLTIPDVRAMRRAPDQSRPADTIVSRAPS
jgi:hypothetical protein